MKLTTLLAQGYLVSGGIHEIRAERRNLKYPLQLITNLRGSGAVECIMRAYIKLPGDFDCRLIFNDVDRVTTLISQQAAKELHVFRQFWL